MSRNRRGTSKTPPTPKVRAGRLSPVPGPWYLNYLLVDRAGPYAWPQVDDPEAGQLSLFLQLLNEEPLENVLNQTRLNGEAANKEIRVDDLSSDAQKRFDVAMSRLGRDDFDPSIFEFTYCFRIGDPRRIWTVYDPMSRVLYPMWWDPRHEVCGWDERYAARMKPGPCPDLCSHPEDLQG